MENGDEARRIELMAEIDALKAKIRRIPFIDPVDIRYRRFETVPKPVAQAVMFCLMDVSGSMSEHMKDLAKRFYMLLYVFLKRRYRHVEIVFIRHTDRAEEVDEETFFHDPASGGTLVSSALQAMHDIVRSRFRPSDWNIYAAQASDGDNSYSDGDVAARLLTESILPVSQFFAYLEVGEAGGNPFGMTDSSLWTLYQRLRAAGAPLSMRKVNDRSEIFPVFHDLFQRRGNSREPRHDHDNRRACLKAQTGIFRRCSASTMPARRLRDPNSDLTSIPTRSRSSPRNRCWMPTPPEACRCFTSTGRSASSSPIRKLSIARACRASPMRSSSTAHPAFPI